MREEQRDEDERREEEGRDLRHRVLHHRDREVPVAPPGHHEAGEVLHGVPGDRNDHEARERLRDPKAANGGIERVDEPVGHEGRADSGHG